MKQLLAFCIIVAAIFVLSGCAVHSQEYKDINAQMRTNETLKHKQKILQVKQAFLVTKQAELNIQLKSINSEIAEVETSLDGMFDNYTK